MSLVALLPWMRNRHYLRDLYDYGLVWAAIGHLERGEKPYVDFTTPIQAGFLGMNWGVGRATGGTYGGLTLGAAALILLSAVLLSLILVRRWPSWLALLAAGAVTIGAASQHTILWHNSLGVFALALVAWSTAVAPVWRRETWGWHLLTVAGLVLGGLNKINFQLIALCAAVAWAVLAGAGRRARWRQVAATITALFVAGAAIPLALELAWTGASLPLWWWNVVALPAGDRLHILENILTWTFLLHQPHAHYGPVLIPQIGLLGLGITVASAIALGWRCRESALNRVVAPLAAVAAGAAGAMLLQSNYEICHIGLAAWFALTVSVWLGFPSRTPSAGMLSVIALPALAIAVTAWVSAWLGQRSQFGYSSAPRSAYVEADRMAPEFRRLAGLRLPPGLAESIHDLAQVLPGPDADGRQRVFFGLGLEWLDRPFPAKREKGEPLWIHWGTSYDAAAVDRLARRLDDSSAYDAVYCTAARNEWPQEIRTILEQKYDRDQIGPRLYRWRPHNPDAVDLTDAFATISALGGNVSGRVLHLDRDPLFGRKDPQGRTVLGAVGRSGQVLLNEPVNRLRGTAEVYRMPGAGDGSIVVRFRVFVHGATPEETLWREDVRLAPGEAMRQVPFVVDPGARRVVLMVNQDDAGGRREAFAGFRDLEILGAVESAEPVPTLRAGAAAATAATAAERAALFAGVGWRPHALELRGALRADDGLVIESGGEIWFHTDYMTGDLNGVVSCVDPAAGGPMVRVVWYKGGRLQPVQNGSVPASGAYPFHVWAAEPGGWIGILVDPGRASPVRVRITHSTIQP